MRRTLIGFAATAVIAIGAIGGAAAFTHDDASGTPEHTVRDFLVEAVVDHDGLDACGYVSSRSLRELPRGTSCVTAVASRARLTLGGERIDTEAAVKALGYRAEREAGGGERVTVSWRGASRSFVLRRATQRELAEYDAPPTPWRIDSGFAGLLAIA